MRFAITSSISRLDQILISRYYIYDLSLRYVNFTAERSIERFWTRCRASLDNRVSSDLSKSRRRARPPSRVKSNRGNGIGILDSRTDRYPRSQFSSSNPRTQLGTAQRLLTDSVLPQGVGGRVASLNDRPRPGRQVTSCLRAQMMRDHAVDGADPDRERRPVLIRAAAAARRLVLPRRRRGDQPETKAIRDSSRVSESFRSEISRNSRWIVEHDRFGRTRRSAVDRVSLPSPSFPLLPSSLFLLTLFFIATYLKRYRICDCAAVVAREHVREEVHDVRNQPPNRYRSIRVVFRIGRAREKGR